MEDDEEDNQGRDSGAKAREETAADNAGDDIAHEAAYRDEHSIGQLCRDVLDVAAPGTGARKNGGVGDG